MKKIIYILIITASIVFSGCEKKLDTVPTDAVGSEQIFSSAENALAAINGVYRAMFISEWGPDWNAENGGYHAYLLASNLMADDMIQNAKGSGWFWFDYLHGISADFTSSSGRQAQSWNFFYSLITNVNTIISYDGKLEGDVAVANSVLGQAYAIRAFAYFELIQRFQQHGDLTLPGVPIYTEPTTIESKGKTRGTVKDVYDRVTEDINTAITKLGEAGAQTHKSHIDQYVAYGIKARVLMVQGNYAEANIAAKAALESSAEILPFSQTSKVNDAAKKNVMWGLVIQTDQSAGSWATYSHIDADAGGTYSNGAQFLISSWLYDQIPATDERKTWWTAPLPKADWVDGTSKKSYIQLKLVYKDAPTETGDYIIMRAEEMALIVAESACHLGQYAEAREYLKKVATLRDTNYDSRLARFTDSKEITMPLNKTIVTLMDEVLFQRRVELWGEASRMFDLQRLGLPVVRDYNTNHYGYTGNDYFAPKAKTFIYSIPMKEFNGNSSLDSVTDQNPID